MELYFLQDQLQSIRDSLDTISRNLLVSSIPECPEWFEGPTLPAIEQPRAPEVVLSLWETYQCTGTEESFLDWFDRGSEQGPMPYSDEVREQVEKFSQRWADYLKASRERKTLAQEARFFAWRSYYRYHVTHDSWSYDPRTGSFNVPRR